MKIKSSGMNKYLFIILCGLFFNLVATAQADSSFRFTGGVKGDIIAFTVDNLDNIYFLNMKTSTMNKCKIDKCDLFVAIISTKYNSLFQFKWNYFVLISIYNLLNHQLIY